MSQLRFSCNITSKRLKVWTRSILVLSILSRKGIIFLFLNLCIMYLDFFMFKDSLLMFSLSLTLFNYVFKCCSISLVHEFKDWIVVNRVVSSAYITCLNVFFCVYYKNKWAYYGALWHTCSNRQSFRNVIIVCEILFSIL